MQFRRFFPLHPQKQLTSRQDAAALMVIIATLSVLVMVVIALAVWIGQAWLIHLTQLREILYSAEAATLPPTAEIQQTAAQVQRLMIVLGCVLMVMIGTAGYGSWHLYRATQNQLFETRRADLSETSLLMALNRISASLTSTLDIDDLLDRILINMGQVVPHDTVTVVLVDEDMTVRVARVHGDVPEGYQEWLARYEGRVIDQYTWATMRENRYGLLIPDTRSYDGWFKDPETYWVRSHLAAPMFVGDDLVGFLHVNSREVRTYTALQVRHVQVFADQAAIAIRNAQLYGDMRRREARLELLVQVARIGTSSGSLADLSQALTSIAAHIVGSDGCFITGWNEAGQQAIRLAAYGSEHDDFIPYTLAPHQRDVTNALERERRALIIPNVMNSPYLDPDVARSFPATSILALPLLEGTQFLGALILSFEDYHVFSNEDVAWARQAAEVISLAIARGTAFAQLEERVAERTESLQAANAIRDVFISSISHELRTPLTSIKVYHSLLEMNPAKAVNYFERLRRETDRLQILIEDLLDVGRLQQRQVAPQIAAFDLCDMARRYLDDRQALAEVAGIKTVKDLPPAPVMLDADPVLIERVLNILYSNALNYNVPGATITVKVADGLKGSGSSVRIQVIDDGEGVPEDEIDLLFTRFYRGKAGRKSNKPGTGLGLSIAREIVELHKGTITAENKPNPYHGAIFTVTLPQPSQADLPDECAPEAGTDQPSKDTVL